MLKSDVPESLLEKIDRTGIRGSAYACEMIRIARTTTEAREAEAALGTHFLLELAGKADVLARCGISREEADGLIVLTHRAGWQETKKKGEAK